VKEWREVRYLAWCISNEVDPELGDSARRYEEEIAGQPIEEWWDEMNEQAEYERRNLT
jgi:hypothetical protein